MGIEVYLKIINHFTKNSTKIRTDQSVPVFLEFFPYPIEGKKNY